MLKRLAVTAAIGALLLGWPCVAENQSRETSAKRSEADQAGKPVPPMQGTLQPPLSHASGEPEPSSGLGQSAEKPLPRFVRPEWVIVYITAVYVLINWLMLRAIKRQADTMEAQAEEASKSAIASAATAQATLEAVQRQANTLDKSAATSERSVAAFINKERARLVVSHSITEDFQASFRAINRGRSTAKVTYCFVGCEIFNKERELTSEKERFREIPDYAGDYESRDLVRDDWVERGSEVRIGGYDASYIDEDNPELLEAVSSGKDVVWFYGIVRYTDHLAPEEHELAFCYRCITWKGKASHLAEDGPAAYRRDS